MSSSFGIRSCLWLPPWMLSVEIGPKPANQKRLRTNCRRGYIERLDATTFKDLLQMWMAIFKLGKHHRNPIPKLSAVNIDHYAHGDPLTTDHDSKCRDITAQFDTTALSAWKLATVEKSEVNHELVMLLESAGVSDPGIFVGIEFELISDYYIASREKCRKLRQQVRAGKRISINDLGNLWGHGFPMHPLEESGSHLPKYICRVRSVRFGNG